MNGKVKVISLILGIAIILIGFGVTFGTLNSQVSANQAEIKDLKTECQFINDKLDNIMVKLITIETKFELYMEKIK